MNSWLWNFHHWTISQLKCQESLDRKNYLWWLGIAEIFMDFYLQYIGMCISDRLIFNIEWTRTYALSMSGPGLLSLVLWSEYIIMMWQRCRPTFYMTLLTSETVTPPPPENVITIWGNSHVYGVCLAKKLCDLIVNIHGTMWLW